MPIVPTYQERQVRPQALQPVLQQTLDVSSGARALAQGLGQVAEAADRRDLRDAQAKAEEADVALTKAWGDWENTNRSKFTNKNADGYTKAVDEWWQEAAKTYGAGLDPRSQAMVGKTLARRRTVAYGQAGQYEVAEKKKYRDSTYSAALNTSLVTALKTGDYDAEAARTRDLVEAYGRDNELDKDQRDAERNARMGAFNTAVVAQLAEKDAAQAQTYLTGAIDRGEIRPDQQPRLEAIIKGEADNQFAKMEAVRLRALPLEQQKAELAKITDPKRLEKTQTELNNLSAIDRRVREETQNAARDQVYQRFEQNQPIPESLLSAMGGPERSQFENLRRARSERLAAGKTVKTNPVELAKVYDMMRDDPEGFKKLRMATLTEAFAPTDIEQISRIQRDMLKPNTEKDVATTTQVMALYTGGYQPEKKAAFNSAFLDEVNSFEKEKGRPATYEEKRKIGERLIVDGEVLSGSIWKNDPNKKYFQATPEERRRFAPTLTTADRTLVKDALIAEGVKNPTEAQIVERFKLAKGIR
jgi:hypothetical protein